MEGKSKYLTLIICSITIGGFCSAQNTPVNESWVYASILDGNYGLPFYNVGVGRIGIGLTSSLHRFGVGLALADGFIAFQEGEIVYLPISIYYLPYVRWNNKGLALPVIYTSISANLLPVNCHYLIPRFGIMWFCFGIESGAIVTSSRFSIGGFHAGLKFSLGGWFRTH